MDILTALLEESEGVGQQQENVADGLDGLFDDDTDGEEYKEGLEETEDQMMELFGPVDDIVEEEKNKDAQETLNKSKEDLQGLPLKAVNEIWM